MKQKKALEQTGPRLSLESGSSGVPPARPPSQALVTPPLDPSLTQKFNRAANQPQLSSAVAQPVSKLQIEALQRKLSRPRATLEMNPLGGVNRTRNPQADRVLMNTIGAMTAVLAARKGVKERFALAANKGELKKSFNRSSNGMSM